MPIQFDSGIHNYETPAASAKRKVQSGRVPVKKQLTDSVHQSLKNHGVKLQ
jgi:hypothetical protein